jgi:hypothetical protein
MGWVGINLGRFRGNMGIKDKGRGDDHLYLSGLIYQCNMKSKVVRGSVRGFDEM